jgi:hypothetical protein
MVGELADISVLNVGSKFVDNVLSFAVNGRLKI